MLRASSWITKLKNPSHLAQRAVETMRWHFTGLLPTSSTKITSVRSEKRKNRRRGLGIQGVSKYDWIVTQLIRLSAPISPVGDLSGASCSLGYTR